MTHLAEFRGGVRISNPKPCSEHLKKRHPSPGMCRLVHGLLLWRLVAGPSKRPKRNIGLHLMHNFGTRTAQKSFLRPSPFAPCPCAPPRTPLSSCNRFTGAVQQMIWLTKRSLGRCIHSFPYLLPLFVVTSPPVSILACGFRPVSASPRFSSWRALFARARLKLANCGIQKMLSPMLCSQAVNSKPSVACCWLSSKYTIPMHRPQPKKVIARNCLPSPSFIVLQM
jgi:hypothetical protein